MSRISTAVILAGGRGLRLTPLTDSLPKALVRIRSKPLLEWIIGWLARGGVKELVIGVAFEKEKIIDYFGDGSRFGVRIKYSSHTVEGGTAEGFRLAIERHVREKTFLAMNGDELTNLDIGRLFDTHVKSGAIATLAVTQLKSPFGVVRLDPADNIAAFDEKATMPGVFVSIGVYAFQREVLEHIPLKGDVERTAFPILSRMGRLHAYRHEGFWATVNNLKELQQAEDEIQRIVPE